MLPKSSSLRWSRRCTSSEARPVTSVPLGHVFRSTGTVARADHSWAGGERTSSCRQVWAATWSTMALLIHGRKTATRRACRAPVSSAARPSTYVGQRAPAISPVAAMAGSYERHQSKGDVVRPIPTLRRSCLSGPLYRPRMKRTARRWQRPRRLRMSQGGNPQPARNSAVHCIATRSNALFWSA